MLQMHKWIALGTLAAALMHANPLAAAPDDSAAAQGELGCVVREPEGARFVATDGRDRALIAHEALAAYRRGARFLAPCLEGRGARISAAAYDAMARRSPASFRLREASLRDPRPRASESARGGGAASGSYDVLVTDGLVAPGFDFFAASAIDNGGRIYGTVLGIINDVFVQQAVVYHQGRTRLIGPPQSYVNVANENGMAGGGVLPLAPDDTSGQAALFRGSGVELIDKLPGQIDTSVWALNQRGEALVYAVDASYQGSLWLYRNGRLKEIDFGPQVPSAGFLHLNDRGEISGTAFGIIDAAGRSVARGFRYDTRSGELMLLHPLPTELESWGLGINDRGEVLGYSFVASGVERIGIWDRSGRFSSYFVEGTPEVPTISNALLFNARNDIVITRVSSPAEEVGVSYLVTRPGQRQSINDMVRGEVPAELGEIAWWIFDINDRGSMIGLTTGSYGVLLSRSKGKSGQ